MKFLVTTLNNFIWKNVRFFCLFSFKNSIPPFQLLLLSAQFDCNVEICNKKFVVETRKNYFVSRNVLIFFLANMRDSNSLVRWLKQTRIHGRYRRFTYSSDVHTYYAQWKTYSHRFVLIGPSHVKTQQK